MSRSVAGLPAIALLLASFVLAPQRSDAMEFELVPTIPGCAQMCVVARGAVTTETSAQLRKFAAKSKLLPGATILLDSLGGDHVVGIATGEAIRKLRFTTQVGRYDAVGGRIGPGVCASACVAMLLGGLERRAVPGSRVGVHQVRLNMDVGTQNAASQAQLLMALAAHHYLGCGAAPDVVTLALSTPPDEMRWLSQRELLDFKVVTEQVAGAEATVALAEADRAQTIRFRLLGLPVAGTGKN